VEALDQADIDAGHLNCRGACLLCVTEQASRWSVQGY